MFRYNKVINEYEFPPLEVLHYLLITLRLGRHFKGEFKLTKRGAELAQSPGKLFAELIPFFVFKIDHASYARFEGRPFGKWDVWMNVINVEADHGTTERALFAAFYGEEHDWDNDGWREMAAFSSCVLRPLEWAGLLVQTHEERGAQTCAPRLQDAALAQHFDARYRRHVAAGFRPVSIRRERTFARDAEKGRQLPILLKNSC